MALSLPLVTSVGAARADQPEARAAARAHFNRGVELAKAGSYEAALAEFQQAYRTSPHFSVLYNIGQAELALGRSSSAIDSLQRYLSEGGEQIDPARRTEVQALIAGEQARLAPPARESETEPAAAPREAPLPPPVDVMPRSVESPSRAPVPPPILAPEERRDAKRPFAYVLGAAGLVLASASAAHYVWNRGRYDEWQEAYDAYHVDPRPERRSRANGLAESVERASLVTVGLAIGAGVMLGSGTALFFSSSAAPPGRVGKADRWLSIRGSF